MPISIDTTARVVVYMSDSSLPVESECKVVEWLVVNESDPTPVFINFMTMGDFVARRETTREDKRTR